MASLAGATQSLSDVIRKFATPFLSHPAARAAASKRGRRSLAAATPEDAGALAARQYYSDVQMANATCSFWPHASCGDMSAGAGLVATDCVKKQDGSCAVSDSYSLRKFANHTLSALYLKAANGHYTCAAHGEAACGADPHCEVGHVFGSFQKCDFNPIKFFAANAVPPAEQGLIGEVFAFSGMCDAHKSAGACGAAATQGCQWYQGIDLERGAPQLWNTAKIQSICTAGEQRVVSALIGRKAHVPAITIPPAVIFAQYTDCGELSSNASLCNGDPKCRFTADAPTAPSSCHPSDADIQYQGGLEFSKQSMYCSGFSANVSACSGAHPPPFACQFRNNGCTYDAMSVVAAGSNKSLSEAYQMHKTCAALGATSHAGPLAAGSACGGAPTCKERPMQDESGVFQGMQCTSSDTASYAKVMQDGMRGHAHCTQHTGKPACDGDPQCYSMYQMPGNAMTFVCKYSPDSQLAYAPAPTPASNDPCASVCPKGTCDSAADAQKPECAACATCQQAQGGNPTAPASNGNSTGPNYSAILAQAFAHGIGCGFAGMGGQPACYNYSDGTGTAVCAWKPPTSPGVTHGECHLSESHESALVMARYVAVCQPRTSAELCSAEIMCEWGPNAEKPLEMACAPNWVTIMGAALIGAAPAPAKTTEPVEQNIGAMTSRAFACAQMPMAACGTGTGCVWDAAKNQCGLPLDALYPYMVVTSREQKACAQHLVETTCEARQFQFQGAGQFSHKWCTASGVPMFSSGCDECGDGSNCTAYGGKCKHNQPMVGCQNGSWVTGAGSFMMQCSPDGTPSTYHFTDGKCGPSGGVHAMAAAESFKVESKNWCFNDQIPGAGSYDCRVQQAPPVCAWTNGAPGVVTGAIASCTLNSNMSAAGTGGAGTPGSGGGSSSNDPCASVCPKGTCDSAADAQKPECAACATCMAAINLPTPAPTYSASSCPNPAHNCYCKAAKRAQGLCGDGSIAASCWTATQAACLAADDIWIGGNTGTLLAYLNQTAQATEKLAACRHSNIPVGGMYPTHGEATCADVKNADVSSMVMMSTSAAIDPELVRASLAAGKATCLCAGGQAPPCMAECAGACVACAKTCVASGGDGADCKECTTRDKCEPCMQCYATRVPNPQDADAMKAARARFEQAATPGAVAAPGSTFAGADKDALAAASQLDTCLSYRGRKPADTSCQSANGEAFSVSSVDVAGLQYNELVGQHKTEVMRAVADGFTACFCTTPRSAGMESSYGSSGGSYGGSGSNGHANPAATCQKCHTADKPMAVNCFTSLADLMNGGQPIEGKGGLLLGTVCAGTEYTQTYTCTQAYDYNFKNRAAADGACAHYKNLCCTAPTPAPTQSESSYGSYGSYGTSMQSSNGNSGVSYGSSAPVSPTNDMLISGLKQLISGMAMDTPTQEKVQQKIRELEAALAGCGGAAVAPSGPMQELTCGGAAGVAQQQVKFMPFDKAFGPNLQAEIAAAKASGNRVCFCR
jgi:hypothetical protein